MFAVDSTSGSIEMNVGDTGAFLVAGTRDDGEDFTEDDRAVFTIKNSNGEIVMMRLYSLDNDDDIGNGVFLVEFHNNDTDTWDPGQYNTELRFDVDPTWDGGPVPTGRCVNALSSGVPHMIEGPVVRTVIQASLIIEGVLGDI